MTVTNRAARADDRVVEHGLQPAHLVGPADERGGVGGLGLAAEPLVHRHGRGAALDLHLAEGFVAVSAACRPPGLLADHDAAARALGLESGSDVQRVADQVGVAGPDHDLAGVHRDAQSEFGSDGFRRPGRRSRRSAPATRLRRRRRGRRRRVRSREHPRRP